MSHFANDIHHRVSTRISEIIPDFVESEYPAFVAFVKAYYEFLEQHDERPVASTYTLQPGVVTIQSGNSTVIGANTQFANTDIYGNNVQFRVGSDEFRIRSIANNTQLVVYEVPVRSYFANTHTVETNKSIRQASGAARQILSIHDVDHTLDDFVSYFRDTYLRDIPQGLTDTKTLLPHILDFYQAKGSEQSYRFLFRSLFGKEIEFSYPRDSVFTTSDNEYVRPILLRLAYDTPSDITGNVALLETREIVGLTSNARATVLRSVVTHEGSRKVARLSISEPIVSRELGGVLLENGSQLLLTKYGVPPEGLANEVYEYNLVQELVKSSTFIAGEQISTIPINDPNAITGTLLGSITGFTINERGAGYQLGDLVYPPAQYANGEIATGGFGAVGRISAFTDVDLTELNINDPGLGYYAGLPLIVDNTGTGGGTGLSGYVSKVSPGNIVLHEDVGAGIADGDTLTFVYETDLQPYRAEREKIDYYQVGISLGDLFGGLLLDDAADPTSDGDDLLDESTGRQLLQESAITLNAAAWSNTEGSAIYAANLQTTVQGLISSFSTFPLYVNGVRTEVGEIYTVTVESFGSGYVLGLPSISVQTPVVPTKDVAGLQPLTYREVFGEDFDAANLTVAKETGQIGQVEVLTGGTGYSNVAFSVNSTTSTTATGDEAELGLTLGALSYGIPYFKNTRSFASSDQHLQDITKYQPFSYVLTVEESLSRYSEILRRLVHPAGGLLLPRQTITTELDLFSSIAFGGIDLTIQILEDPFSNPPSLYTINVIAPPTTVSVTLNVSMNVINVAASVVTQLSAVTILSPSNSLSSTNDVTAPTVMISTVVTLPTTLSTTMSSYENESVLLYEFDPLYTVANWESPGSSVVAPSASI